MLYEIVGKSGTTYIGQVMSEVNGERLEKTIERLGKEGTIIIDSCLVFSARDDYDLNHRYRNRTAEDMILSYITAPDNSKSLRKIRVDGIESYRLIGPVPSDGVRPHDIPRISLDQPGQGYGPRTIRLRRPSDQSLDPDDSELAKKIRVALRPESKTPQNSQDNIGTQGPKTIRLRRLM
jgi:hypothetical protein